ncbi:uncharacterized protein FFE2_06314 [Fusarium fujikuroi]|nr:uncharacterized protein FFE2_06314 [Fusarium fujikuroi]
MVSYSRTNIHDAIVFLEPQMDYICKVSGATGLSLSVVSGGEEAYAKHLGFRDVEVQNTPDGDTTYFIGSVTKGIVAVLVGILVEEGKLGWSTRVASVLPELQDAFEGRGSQITIADLLSHRTGVARSDAIWISRAGNILLPKDFRNDFLYNNYAYDVEKVWEPMGMHRTSVEDLAGNSNAAKAYYALEDASSYEVPIPTISHETIMGAGGAIRSCTNDLAKYYCSFMKAVNHQFNNNTTSTPNSPFKQLTTILRPHNQLGVISLGEQSYALGWGRAQLPCPLGTLNYNYLLIPLMPVIGQGAPSQLTLYHGGSIQGFNTAAYLLPETETAIIAMQNSSGLGDACDWIPQIIMHTLSGSTERIGFLHLATVAVRAALSLPEKIDDELETRRERGTRHMNLEAYTGRYWNALQNFRIDPRTPYSGRQGLRFRNHGSDLVDETTNPTAGQAQASAPANSDSQDVSTKLKIFSFWIKVYEEILADKDEQLKKILDAYDVLLERAAGTDGGIASSNTIQNQGDDVGFIKDSSSAEADIGDSSSSELSDSGIHLLPSARRVVGDDAKMKAIVKIKLDEMQQKEWVLKWPGHVFKVQTAALNPYAGLAWAGATELVARYKIVEEDYIYGKHGKHEDFEKILVAMYNKITLFYIKAACYFAKSTLKRMLRGVATLDDWKSTLTNLTKADEECQAFVVSLGISASLKKGRSDLGKAEQSRPALKSTESRHGFSMTSTSISNI